MTLLLEVLTWAARGVCLLVIVSFVGLFLSLPFCDAAKRADEQVERLLSGPVPRQRGVKAGRNR